MCFHTLASAQLSTFQLVNAKLAQAQPSRPGGTAYSKVRSGQPSIAAVNSTGAGSTATAPARVAIFSSWSGENVCRSTTASSAAAREDSSSSAWGRRQLSSPGNLVTLVATRQVSVDRVGAYLFSTG